MSTQTVRAAILAKLNGLATPKQVTDYMPNEFGNYPAVALTVAGGDGEYISRYHVERTRRFRVFVFVERTAFTPDHAEDVFVSVLDEIENALDNDITLGGAVKYCKAVEYVVDYEDREVNIRLGTITLEAVEIVTTT